MKKHILFLAIFLFTLGIVNASTMAVIVHSKGFNKVRRDGKNLKAVPGMILQNGDELKTSRKGQLGIKTSDGEASIFLFSKSRASLNASPLWNGLEKNVELQLGSIHVRNNPQNGSLSCTFGNNDVQFEDVELLIKKDKKNNVRLSVLAGAATLSDREGSIKQITTFKTSYILSKGEFISRWMDDSDLSDEERARIEPQSNSLKNRIVIPLADEQGRILNVELSW